MNDGKTVFAQLMHFAPYYEFQKCVARYNGNYKVINFKCSDQFRCMAFAQLTYRESLRDIEACLRVAKPKLYHMGIRSTASRNNLAHANETRDWRIYADFAQVLIKIARELYANDDFGLELKQAVYAFDSTTFLRKRWSTGTDGRRPCMLKVKNTLKRKGNQKIQEKKFDNTLH